jgi:class 3 adenylate cyclase
MDAPPIHYARAADGVNIAYWTLGEGEPLIWVNDSNTNHAELEWRSEWFRRWYEALAADRMLVKFDARGTGLSDRTVADYALPARVSDVAAVVDALDLEACALVGGHGHAGSVVMQYALDHADQVTRLVLIDAVARVQDLYAVPETRALGKLTTRSWNLYALAMSHVLFGRDSNLASEFADVVESSMGGAQAAKLHLAAGSIDLTDSLGTIACPTLVLAHEESSLPYVSWARQLASGIPSASLRIMPGMTGEHLDDEIRAVTDFLAVAVPATEPTGFRTILFTDVVASTPLLAQLKDAKMREVMRDHDTVLQTAVDEAGGRVIKTIGDAFMAEFAVPSAAVDCAIAMQRGIQAQFADSDVPIRLRIGINAGEPIAEDDDLHGISVNIAKRLESAAETNGILVSDVVKAAVAGKDFEFVDQGEVSLKGVDEPARTWSVGWE